MGLRNFWRGNNVNKHRTGKIDKSDQGNAKKVLWDASEWVEQSSTLVSSINNKIANDVASFEFRHFRVTTETGQYENRLDDSIFEVLNFASNGEKSNFDFWTKVTKRMLNAGMAFVRINETESGNRRHVDSLTLLDADPKSYDDVIVLKSPYKIKESQLRTLDNILSTLATKYGEHDVKAIIKPNAILNERGDAFQSRMQETMDAFYQYAEEYHIGVLDQKSDYEELKNDYQTVTADEVNLVKNEIFAAYGLNPSIMSGTYTDSELRAYYNNVVGPIKLQLYKELNTKMLSDYRRVVSSDKKTYETIRVTKSSDADGIEYATMSEIASVLQQSANIGIMSRNEARKLFNLPPVDGGDVIVTNLNNVEVTEEPSKKQTEA